MEDFGFGYTYTGIHSYIPNEGNLAVNQEEKEPVAAKTYCKCLFTFYRKTIHVSFQIGKLKRPYVMVNSLLSSLVHFPFTHLRLFPTMGKTRISLSQIKKLQGSISLLSPN